ncbi:MAG: hypothetical protein MJ219_03020 [Mycoplasmoidaceae bacterium]|nr:hypothetical protein [Mycoplasmoidaceae bacterium]
MIDKEYIKHLTKNLCFELSDEQTNKIIKEIQDLDRQLKESNFEVDNIKFAPVNNPRVINFAKLRPDIPDKKLDKDYLSNAKVANKYVVGK